jgi:oligopeptide transport system permease protein
MSGRDEADEDESARKDGGEPASRDSNDKSLEAAPEDVDPSAPLPDAPFKPVDEAAPADEDEPLAAVPPEVAPGGANLFAAAAASLEGEEEEGDPLFDYLLTPREETPLAPPPAPPLPPLDELLVRIIPPLVTPQAARLAPATSPPPEPPPAIVPSVEPPTAAESPFSEALAAFEPEPAPPVEPLAAPVAAIVQAIEATEPAQAAPEAPAPAEAFDDAVLVAPPDALAEIETDAPAEAFHDDVQVAPRDTHAEIETPDAPAEASDDIVHDAPLDTLAEIEAGGAAEPYAYAAAALAAPMKGRSLWQDSRRRLFRNPAAVGSLYVVGALIVIAVLGPLLWVHKVGEIFPDYVGAAPTFRDLHLLGTDTEGRDMVARVLFGLGISLLVGLAATIVALTIGVLWGAVAGFLGGAVDELMMRFVDMLYSVPFIFFVIVLMTVARTENAFLNLMLIFLAIGAVEWLTMARIVRGQTIALRRREFVEAARAAGARPMDIVLRHIVPNVLGPVVVFATLNIPVIILAESFLSFLGLGVQEPLTSLGKLIADGMKQMQAPWMLISPAVVMVVTLLALNFLGDGLRDALDPKER